MIAARTKLILTAVAALATAFAADYAHGGFIRVQSVLSPQGEASLLWSAGLSQDDTSMGAAGPVAPTAPGLPGEDEQAFRNCQGIPAGGSAGCESASSSQSVGNGANSAAITSTIVQVPQTSLIGRLPCEMGPTFSNPPPWTPLRPPRG